MRRSSALFLLCFSIAGPGLLTGCLAGASSALSGGPIGRAPDLKERELLAEPDTTRGQDFLLISNRRDLLDETRVELNAAARAYERLLGARPQTAEIRLTSSERDVEIRITVRGRTIPSTTLPLQGGGRGARVPDAMRIGSGVVQAMSREWLSGFLAELTPNESRSSAGGWMQEARIAPWLRLGLLQGVAENPMHEMWLAQLGRQRDSLPSVAQLLRADACDQSCLAPFAGTPQAANASGETSSDDDIASARNASRRGPPGRGRLLALDNRMRYVASSYALAQFFAKREGPTFIRQLVASSLVGDDLSMALGTARSFTSSLDDIDRQWRVWLATYAYGTGGLR